MNPPLLGMSLGALVRELGDRHPELVPAMRLADYAHVGATRTMVRVGITHRDPYVTHPLRCALRLDEWLSTAAGYITASDARDMLTAMLLHDTVEDAQDRIRAFLQDIDDDADADPLELIELRFGAGASDIVHRVTTPAGTSGPERYLAHLRTAVIPSPPARLVKASDMVDNAGTLHLLPDTPRRARLASKYRNPVRELAEAMDMRNPAQATAAAELVAIGRRLGELARL